MTAVKNTATEMKQVEISKLVPYVNNARTHSPEQITKLRSSLREFGFVNPVIIAIVNSVFRIVTAILLFPLIKQIERLVLWLVKDSEEDLEDIADNADFDLLEERLLTLPALALGQANRVITGMSRRSVRMERSPASQITSLKR